MPVKGVAYSFAIYLTDQSNRYTFKSAPTLATGDFQISKDGGVFANLATLPTVEPTGGSRVKVSLSATEMAADILDILAVDAAGAEWDPLAITIKTNDYSNFEFVMYDANGDPSAGLTVTAQKSVNGGAYASATNSVVAVGSGTYKINPTPDIPSTGIVTFRFTASGAKEQAVTIAAEP